VTRSGKIVTLFVEKEQQKYQIKFSCERSSSMWGDALSHMASGAFSSPRSIAAARSEGKINNREMSSSSRMMSEGPFAHAPRPFVPETRGMPRDTVPTRFLVGCNMNAKEAARRWAATWEWRREFGADELLSCRFFLAFNDPPSVINDMQRLYLHGFHGRSKENGTPVYYDRISPQVRK